MNLKNIRGKNNFSLSIHGFTLAEILITLSIIGVIASMTIPSLVQDIQDAQYKAAWKKAFSVATQNYMMAIQKNAGGFGSYTCGGSLAKWNAFIENFQKIKSCNGNTLGNCWASDGVTPYVPGGSANCPGFSKDGQNSGLAFVAADGTYWLRYPGCDLIAVDLNGPKGPNQWNKDVMTFDLDNRKIRATSCLSPNIPALYLYQ